MEKGKPMLKQDSRIGICGCSNGLPEETREQIQELENLFRKAGLLPEESACLFAKKSIFSGNARERAEALMEMYRDPEIQAVFDISGGNIASGVLEYLDFDFIRQHPKPLFGYSDLTPVLNALAFQAGIPACLYQVRNLVSPGPHQEDARRWFFRSIIKGADDLFSFPVQFLQGTKMEGIVAGGNARCLLKLAGTPYLPDFQGKILFLEALGGDVGAVTSYFTQIRQMGVFQKINGLLLGTFTQMQDRQDYPAAAELALALTGNPSLPIAQTMEIGHAPSSKALWIGRRLSLGGASQTIWE